MEDCRFSRYHTHDIGQQSFLITGGAGFIGSHIVDYLIQYGAKRVRVLDSLITGDLRNIDRHFDNPRFEFIKGDIRDLLLCQQSCENIDYVSHQAALGSVPRSIEDPLTTNNVNIGGHLNMLIACKNSNVKRMIYAASSSTYGDSIQLPKVEDKIGKPLSPYAITKFVNELYSDVFFRTYGVLTIGLRYFNIFGPRQNPQGAYAAVIPLFISSILNNNSPKINGSGGTSRDFTYVNNAVQANIRAFFVDDLEAINQIYNIACGKQITLNELVKGINDINGNYVPPIYGPEREGDVKHSLADISKAQRLLNYSVEVDIVEGLKITYDWYKDNKHMIKLPQ